MIMAATVQAIGAELVRQYYTLLNKAPHHLYRFYGDDSSFSHDGENNLEKQIIIGKEAINKRIEEMNIQDTHAVIMQIDSQETLNNGILVQVIGELSNNGQQMRRFAQTIVLAPVGSNRFQIYNDIFRYQSQSTDGFTSVPQIVPNLEGSIAQDLSQTYNDSENIKNKLPDEHNRSDEDDYSKPLKIEVDKDVYPSNFSSGENVSVPETTAVTFSTSDGMSMLKPFKNCLRCEKSTQTVLRNPQCGFIPSETCVHQENCSPVQEKPQIIKTNSRKFPCEGCPVPEVNGRKLLTAYPDIQQLFVGNLDCTVTEEELQEYFGKFGQVQAVYINRNNGKVTDGRSLNYGFIVFKDPRSVQWVISKSEVHTMKNQRLNVEGKRPRYMISSMTRSGSKRYGPSNRIPGEKGSYNPGRMNYRRGPPPNYGPNYM